MPCMGQFVVGLLGVSLCCVRESFFVCLGEICVCSLWVSLSGFGGLSVCCVWESLAWVWKRVCVLCVEQFGTSLGELFCVVCGRVWSGFLGSDYVLFVGQFGAGLNE